MRKSKIVHNRHAKSEYIDDSDDNVEGGPPQTLEGFIEELFPTPVEEIKAPEPGEFPSLAWLRSNYKTKSAAIRYLVSQEWPIKTIAKNLGLKYQHVRNVATQQLKRGPNEDWRPKPKAPASPLIPGDDTDDEFDER